MCGIVAGIAERNIVPILLEGLKRLEYRGYDSSGIALLDEQSNLVRVRSKGKIKNLRAKIENTNAFIGQVGVAHTRWATHGVPSENNAHPHISNEQISVVHNGIIENYQTLKTKQIEMGYVFTSETDTEVVAHCIHNSFKQTENLLKAIQQSVKNYKGAYSLAVIEKSNPNVLVVARKGSPLVIGIGIGEYFVASDVSALLPVTQSFIFLEDGDTAEITRAGYQVYNEENKKVTRDVKQSALSSHSVELGEYRHYMHKEIYEQPQAVIDTLEGRVTHEKVLVSAFGYNAEAIFKEITQIQIVACGTSYHAGLVAKYWFEDIIGVPCQVEVASEYRYRNPVILNNTLFVTLSQSGETADTLAALHKVNECRSEYVISTERERTLRNDALAGLLKKSEKPCVPTVSICNVAESSLTRESDLVFLTHAGTEIGVASTKAFTTQLVALALLVSSIGKAQNKLKKEVEKNIVEGLHRIPSLIINTLTHEAEIEALAKGFADKSNALFLGRGAMYPIAMEGALKLKEISYIHAEAYPAGELKHGPLALIDESIPVVAIAPNDELLDKLKSNLHEVSARGGTMLVFEDEASGMSSQKEYKVIKVTKSVGRVSAPIVFNIALQLLSYHVALIKGTDVDQPRNLAKSVTVE